jgi:hypothetical protein
VTPAWAGPPGAARNPPDTWLVQQARIGGDADRVNRAAS